MAKYLSFSRAADNLYITQPALSRHILDLETNLGIELFHRTKQTVELTPAGALFQTRITDLIDDYDDICSRLRIMKDGYNNRLRIGVPYYAMRDYLGHIPERFEHMYPDIKLQYSVGDPNEVINSLLADQVDLVILSKYLPPESAHIEFVPVFNERLGVLLNKNDPLSQKNALFLSDLKNKTFFSVNNNYFNAMWHQMIKLCKEEGFTPRGPAYFNQMEALFMAIRRGDGITVIGQHMRHQEGNLVCYRPLDGTDCSRDICISYKKDNPDTAISKFIKLYKTVTINRD